MKRCPKCGEKHEKSGKFCSRSCANSRKFSESAKKKKSESLSKWHNDPKNKRQKEEMNKKAGVAVSKIRRKQLMESDFETLGITARRKRILIEQDGKCGECGIQDWNNKPIVIEYHHIDGNPKNNKRENAIGLCPNCHSQTDNWKCAH